MVKTVFNEMNRSLDDIFAIENDPGLGQGGLGRLAASFLESMAMLEVPSLAYGLRYESGFFKQKILGGVQKELADNWLDKPNIWEYKRRNSYQVKLGGNVEIHGSGQSLIFNHVNYESIKAVCYDMPFIAYKKNNVNELRLWSAESFDQVDYDLFATGFQQDSFSNVDRARAITQFLYPNDTK